jgi:hypothetical protein
MQHEKVRYMRSANRTFVAFSPEQERAHVWREPKEERGKQEINSTA